jgi:6-pyruvoyltetrahydropterin/6-carboxytetrahydropterin synthase
MIYLTKKMRFSASHRLDSDQLTPAENWQCYGKCGNVETHGHNYLMEVTVCGIPNPKSGMVTNLQTVKQIITDRIIKRVDHRCLNDDVPLLAGVIPTLENLVLEFWKILEDALPKDAMLYCIRLFETPDSYAEYYGPTQISHHNVRRNPKVVL